MDALVAVLHASPCKTVESTAAACLANMCIYDSDFEDDDGDSNLRRAKTSENGHIVAPHLGFVQHPLDPHAAMRSEKMLKRFNNASPKGLAV